MLFVFALLFISAGWGAVESAQMPIKSTGLYLLLAGDYLSERWHADKNWDPRLHQYQQTNIHVLYFAFINPGTMKVPLSFQSLAATRNTQTWGAVQPNQLILFSIGGAAYSKIVNPWHWLESREAAEAMANQVAYWPGWYGCDGIDIDLESGAGSTKKAGENMIHFVRQLTWMNPGMIINMAVARRPYVWGQMNIINQSWNADRSSNNLVQNIQIMRYKAAESLLFVPNYNQATTAPYGPIVKWWNNKYRPYMQSNVPKHSITVGCKGGEADEYVTELADAALSQGLSGIMSWYGSVINGYHFRDTSSDMSKDFNRATQLAFGKAKVKFDDYNARHSQDLIG